MLLAIAAFVRDHKPLALIVPPVVLLLLSTQATVNIGIRYILPAFPFLLVLIGRAASVERWRSVVAVACLCSMSSAIWCSPHSLSYFNESVGGPRNGGYFLADSNIDWGQGLRLLRRHLERTDAVADIEYFGSADLNYYLGDRIARSRQDDALAVRSIHKAATRSDSLGRIETRVGYSLSVARRGKQ